MSPVQDLNNLYFFAKVVDFGSYTAAAKALDLQTTKLSRRVAALQIELGVRLINYDAASFAHRSGQNVPSALLGAPR